MVRATLLVLLRVITFTLFPLVVGNSEQAPPPSCPSLPEQGPANTVSLYVAKALEVPGTVCIRVINGFSKSIETRRIALQKWEEGKLWGLWGRGFRQVAPKPPPAGPIFPGSIGALLGPPPGIADMRLPFPGQTTPPGRYRVCISYRPPGQEKYQEVCSEEFFLP